MEPKDKAKELFNKYFEYVEAYTISGQLENTKQCAIIAVDECLHTCVESMIYYWQQVKAELEKL